MKRKVLITMIIGLVVILMIGSYFVFRSPWKYRGDEPVKLLILNSYHPDSFVWTEDQMRGFAAVLDEIDLEMEIRVFNMDTKSNTSEEWFLESARRAMEVIDSWKPDVVYATDDNAQKYVGVNYLNEDFIWVFSGVNAEAEAYGYPARNVAGVLERDPFEFTINSIRNFYPYSSKIVVIGDFTTTGDIVFEWLKKEKNKFPDLNFVAFEFVDNFEDYKEKILFYQDEADIILFTDMNFIDDSEKFYKWTAENSNIPEISFGNLFALNGGLFSVSLSGEEQGELAGEIVKKILIDGEAPLNIPFDLPLRGNQHINLARAESLDLEIPSIVLINSEVVEKFPWEAPLGVPQNIGGSK